MRKDVIKFCNKMGWTCNYQGKKVSTLYVHTRTDEPQEVETLILQEFGIKPDFKIIEQV